MADKKIIVEREALSSLSSHIRTKSGSEALTLTWPQGFIDEVDNISTGVDVTGVTATAGDIVGPAKTFDLNGNLVTGTIQQQTTTNRSITAASQTETVSAGYYPSSFTVSIPSSAVTGLSASNMLNTATVLGITGTIAPRTSTDLTVTSIDDTKTIQAGYYPSNFTVSVPSSVGTSLAANMLSSTTILGVTGTIPTRTLSTTNISTSTGAGSSVSIPAGYYANAYTVGLDSTAIADLNSNYILENKTILGVNGNIPTITPSKLTLTTASDYATIPVGYNATVKTITVDSSALTGLDADKMLSTATILGVTGTIPTQTVSNRVITTQSQIETINAGYYPNSFTVQSNLRIVDSVDANGHNIRTIGGAS